jgi:hypothetical protein
VRRIVTVPPPPSRERSVSALSPGPSRNPSPA